MLVADKNCGSVVEILQKMLTKITREAGPSLVTIGFISIIKQLSGLEKVIIFFQ